MNKKTNLFHLNAWQHVAPSSNMQKFNTYAGDNRVAMTASTKEFLAAIKAGYPYVTRTEGNKPDISNSLKELSYKELSKLPAYGININISPDKKCEIDKDFPEDIRHIITQRALLFSSITKAHKLTMLFGSPKVYKDHIHLGPTLITPLLGPGPEWPKPNGTRGTTSVGDDVFVAPKQLHSSPKTDKKRIIIAIGIAPAI